MKRVFASGIFAFIFLLTIQPPVFSQDTTLSANNTVVVHKDPRIDMLMSKQAQINEETSRDSRKTGKGYRLMVISTSSRDEAIAAKTKVYTHFPELKAYLWHQSPYYKLKAGNFKERKDAEVYQQKLSAYFPKGVFIMNDIVELKLEKTQGEDL